MSERAYSSNTAGPASVFTQARRLLARTGDMDAHAAAITAEVRDAERMLGEIGVDIAGTRILDVGCGQICKHAEVFARSANVVGIDYEVVARGFDPAGYVRMLGRHGPFRTAKTLGRKLAGVDRRYRASLTRHIGPRTHDLTVRTMDAGNLQFDDASFDIVFSSDTFEHLPDPAAAAREIARVVKPGGAAFVRTHLYTSDSGHHDLRCSKHAEHTIALWAHLRPEHTSEVEANAWVNKLSLADWRALFAEHMPGCEMRLGCDKRTGLAERLAELRAAGELVDYTDDELLTVDVITLWRKPAEPAT